MNRNVGEAFEQCPVELARPQALAADLRKRPVADLVPGGRDRDDLDPLGAPVMRVPQGGGDHAGLGEGERRTARADT